METPMRCRMPKANIPMPKMRKIAVSSIPWPKTLSPLSRYFRNPPPPLLLLIASENPDQEEARGRASESGPEAAYGLHGVAAEGVEVEDEVVRRPS